MESVHHTANAPPKSSSNNYILYLTLAIVGLLLIIWIYLIFNSESSIATRIQARSPPEDDEDEAASEYEYEEVTDDEGLADEDIDNQGIGQLEDLNTIRNPLPKIRDTTKALEKENANLRAKSSKAVPEETTAVNN